MGSFGRGRSALTGVVATMAMLVLARPGLAADTLADLLRPFPGPPSILRDRAGRVFGEIRGERHQHAVALADVPESLRQALIDTEDPGFYGNVGFDPKGLARAMFKNLLAGEAREGGSTLTQQLAKTLIQDRRKTLDRKLREAMVTVQLTRGMTKDQILERYLNEVWWGRGAYGVAAAAEVYFGKPASRLDPGQGAVLVAMLKGPSQYDPFSDDGLDRLIDRQRFVLGRMVDAGHLKADRLDREARTRQVARWRAGEIDGHGLRRHLGIKRSPRDDHGWFRRRLQSVLEARLGPARVQEGGLVVQTTLDARLQELAVAAAEEAVRTDGARMGFGQVAMAAVEPGTGHVLALVGGVGATDYDRTMANLQPGSCMKPFVYLAAFASGRTPEDVVVDAAARYPAGNGRWYQPRNDDGRIYGALTLRAALEQSVNTVAVRTYAEVGRQPVEAILKAAGMRGPHPRDLTLALGSGATNPIELAAAYAAFANKGQWVQPQLHVRVVGGGLDERPAPRRAEVAPPHAVSRLVSVLSGVLERGTAKGQGIGRPAAGKTGTTSAFRDAWFVGFTPQVSLAVWVGNDDRAPMKDGAFGGRVAARIWRKVMKDWHSGLPVRNFLEASPPPGLPSPGPTWDPFQDAEPVVLPGARESSVSEGATEAPSPASSSPQVLPTPVWSPSEAPLRPRLPGALP